MKRILCGLVAAAFLLVTAPAADAYPCTGAECIAAAPAHPCTGAGC